MTGQCLALQSLTPCNQAECIQPTELTSCRAIQGLLQAKAIDKHDCTLLQLGKVHALRADYSAAMSVYLEALQLDPGNAETLTTIGLLYLRTGQNQKAFDFLGNALSHDPKSIKAILAAASVIQARFYNGNKHLYSWTPAACATGPLSACLTCCVA